MQKRRLFIAINLPEEVKIKLLKYQEKCLSTEALAEVEDKISWVRKNNLHITLVFIGYASDDETYEIAKSMREVAKKHEPFFINLKRIIAGPPDGMPRMFWVEGEKSQKLADLQRDLENAISGQNFAQKEVRAYSPHITLARFKYDVAKKIKEMGNIEEIINYQIPVNSIELMQSDLRRTGPIYTILELVELGNN